MASVTSSESYIFLAVIAVLTLVALIYLLSPMSLPDEPLVYLIGGNHAVQFESQTFGESVHKKREAFKAHVAEVIDTLDLEILAEEFSEDAKKVWRVNETVLEHLAKTKSIDYRPCDPTSSEKEGRGIEVDPRKETDSDRDKRRRFWLSKIADCQDRRVLFVCGDKHYDSFAQLLETNGFNVQRGAHYDISDEEFLDL